MAIRYLLKMGGRYDWLFVTLSDRGVLYGYSLVTKMAVISASRPSNPLSKVPFSVSRYLDGSTTG